MVALFSRWTARGPTRDCRRIERANAQPAFSRGARDAA
jgi:hypothetical protein